MAEHEKKAAPPADCLITDIVPTKKARGIAKRFFDGESPRAIARVFGLSRGGVEHLIRVQCRLRSISGR